MRSAKKRLTKRKIKSKVYMLNKNLVNDSFKSKDMKWGFLPSSPILEVSF